MNNNEKEALRWYLQGTRDARTAGRNSKNRDLDVFYIPTRYPSGIPDGAPFEYFRLQHAEKGCRAFDEVHAVVRISLDPLSENTDRT